MRCALVLSLAALGVAAPAVAGTISGKVEMVEKGGRKASDLSDVVVYLEGVKAKLKPGKATVTMARKAFTPHVVVVSVGGTVDFPNDEGILHNAFSLTGDNKFDLGLYKRPKSGSWTFEHPGIVRVYCNIHPQMSAIVVVRDNPYFAKAGADGSFTIEGVPAGRYTVTAWHERANEASTEVTVGADGAATAQLSLDASTFKRVGHRRKDGSDYGSEERY